MCTLKLLIWLYSARLSVVQSCLQMIFWYILWSKFFKCFCDLSDYTKTLEFISFYYLSCISDFVDFMYSLSFSIFVLKKYLIFFKNFLWLFIISNLFFSILFLCLTFVFLSLCTLVVSWFSIGSAVHACICCIS